VARFLGGRLDFNGIARLLGASVDRFGQAGPAAPSLEGLVALDTEVRAFAEAYR
jgi:1-deoxy-D-xylulose 5-phosphate reductoisomerase